MAGRNTESTSAQNYGEEWLRHRFRFPYRILIKVSATIVFFDDKIHVKRGSL